MVLFVDFCLPSLITLSTLLEMADIHASSSIYKLSIICT